MLLSPEDPNNPKAVNRVAASNEMLKANSDLWKMIRASCVKLTVMNFNGSGVILGTFKKQTDTETTQGVVIATALHNMTMAYKDQGGPKTELNPEVFFANKLELGYRVDAEGKPAKKQLCTKDNIRFISTDQKDYDAILLEVTTSVRKNVQGQGQELGQGQGQVEDLYTFAVAEGIKPIETAVYTFVNGGPSQNPIKHLGNYPNPVQAGFGMQHPGVDMGGINPLQFRKTKVKDNKVDVEGVFTEDGKEDETIQHLVILDASAEENNDATWNSSYSGDSGGPVFALKHEGSTKEVEYGGVVAVTAGSNMLPEQKGKGEFPITNNGATLLWPLYKKLAEPNKN